MSQLIAVAVAVTVNITVPLYSFDVRYLQISFLRKFLEASPQRSNSLMVLFLL